MDFGNDLRSLQRRKLSHSLPAPRIEQIEAALIDVVENNGILSLLIQRSIDIPWTALFVGLKEHPFMVCARILYYPCKYLWKIYVNKFALQ